MEWHKVKSTYINGITVINGTFYNQITFFVWNKDINVISLKKIVWPRLAEVRPMKRQGKIIFLKSNERAAGVVQPFELISYLWILNRCASAVAEWRPSGGSREWFCNGVRWRNGGPTKSSGGQTALDPLFMKQKPIFMTHHLARLITITLLSRQCRK